LEEASTSNLFLFQQGESGALHLITPAQGILKGIIYQEIHEWALSQHIQVLEKPITLRDLHQACGTFLSNSGSMLKSASYWTYAGNTDKQPIVWSFEAQQIYQTLKEALKTRLDA
jgi:branched-subunit amino acid aminotransferase/4-amino-4-deoxychorismate lyase